MSNDDLPKAVVVQEGKVSGDVPAAKAPEPAAPRPRHKRHISNYLLDKRLQLRYLLLVTVMSTLIAGTLGMLIYRQQNKASKDVAAQVLQAFDDEDLVAVATAKMAKDDRTLIFKMVGAGAGLIVILSMYLLLMTHKVAGPLYKVSLYFDKMAAGKMGHVTALRKGDMLNDFYDGFCDMHKAVRGRLVTDVSSMQKFLDACAAAGVERTGALGEELTALEQHVAERKKALA